MLAILHTFQNWNIVLLISFIGWVVTWLSATPYLHIRIVFNSARLQATSRYPHNTPPALNTASDSVQTGYRGRIPCSFSRYPREVLVTRVMLLTCVSVTNATLSRFRKRRQRSTTRFTENRERYWFHITPGFIDRRLVEICCSWNPQWDWRSFFSQWSQFEDNFSTWPDVQLECHVPLFAVTGTLIAPWASRLRDHKGSGRLSQLTRNFSVGPETRPTFTCGNRKPPRGSIPGAAD